MSSSWYTQSAASTKSALGSASSGKSSSFVQSKGATTHLPQDLGSISASAAAAYFDEGNPGMQLQQHLWECSGLRQHRRCIWDVRESAMEVA